MTLTTYNINDNKPFFKSFSLLKNIWTAKAEANKNETKRVCEGKYTPKKSSGYFHRNDPISEKMTFDDKMIERLSQLLSEHFNSNSTNQLAYNSEDPSTWPSNWKTQVPAMILDPDQYVKSKPDLNQSQKQLAYRVSERFQPLLKHLTKQIAEEDEKDEFIHQDLGTKSISDSSPSTIKRKNKFEKFGKFATWHKRNNATKPVMKTQKSMSK
jgi:hypothetical protein